ncbi:hypothetical protein Hanom_Chr16g01474631 [Helianthus anomalus]
MIHPWEDYDVSPTWRIILQGWSITIPCSLRIGEDLECCQNEPMRYFKGTVLQDLSSKDRVNNESYHL